MSMTLSKEINKGYIIMYTLHACICAYHNLNFFTREIDVYTHVYMCIYMYIARTAL